MVGLLYLGADLSLLLQRKFCRFITLHLASQYSYSTFIHNVSSVAMQVMRLTDLDT